MDFSKIIPKPRLCFLFFSDFFPTATVLTIRLEGEEEEDVKRHLKDAFNTLPFRTQPFLARFAPSFQEGALLENLEIDEIVDHPGAPVVTLIFSLHSAWSFFLPRDPVTGEFIQIADQIRCLFAITPFHIRKEHAEWFETQKERLGINE